jgi:hypothetical protein
MDLATAQTQYDAALASYNRALDAQSVTAEGRTVTRQDIGQLLKQVNYWSRVIQRLQTSAMGVGGYSTARWD